MKSNSIKIPHGTIVRTDVCVIGGGGAGIAIALELARSGRSVILVPGGAARQTRRGIDLYKGTVLPERSHEPLEENRLRMWGGTTTVWGGRCIPFDPIDFERRDWVPGSGWPIALESLREDLEWANRFSDAGPIEFDARKEFPGTHPEIIPGVDNEDLFSWPLERWSLPTDYSRKFGREIAKLGNLDVLMGASVTELHLDPMDGTVRGATVKDEPERRFEIQAKQFVLAAGALETARLLLASNKVAKAGIGNDHDLVGRYYQSHRFGVCGAVQLKDPATPFHYAFEKDREGVYCRRRFWLSPAAQRRTECLNIIGFFFRSVTSSSEHRNSMVSMVLLAKIFLTAVRRRNGGLRKLIGGRKAEIREHLGIVARDLPALPGHLYLLAMTRLLSKRRLPMILPPRAQNTFPVFFQSEHTPLRDSRVTLNPDDRDEYGTPRLRMQVKFCDLDFRTIRTFISVLGERIERSGNARFVLSEADRAYLDNLEAHPFNSNSHHIGTTRMGADPRTGVVDTNCLVYGTKNLYVASSAVFPTSSHANPTLMILALAKRLTQHLKRL